MLVVLVGSDMPSPLGGTTGLGPGDRGRASARITIENVPLWDNPPMIGSFQLILVST